MKSEIFVSVLVPCYNVEKYLTTCLLSLVNQTLENIEIICVNDGSTDNTLRILNEFKEKDKRISVINKKNTGYGDSMNQALEIAKGEYIGIVESDDFCDVTMFEKLYAIAKKNCAEIARCCFFRHKSSGKVVSNVPVKHEKTPKNKILNPNTELNIFFQSPAIWCSIYKGSWLRENNIRFLPTPGASYQDTSFAFKCRASCSRYFMIDEPLLYYRVDSENSSSKNKNKIFCVCDEWSEIFRFLSSDKKKFGHLYNLVPRLQYNTYMWNYNRLSPENRAVFCWKWGREAMLHLLKGEYPLNSTNLRKSLKPFALLISKMVQIK